MISRPLVFPGLLLLFLPLSAVSAAGARPQLGRCAAIEEDDRRLACFDEVTKRLGLSAKESAESAWTVERPGGGLLLSRSADREIVVNKTVFLPTLSVNCDNGRATADFRTGMPAADETGTVHKTVLLQFDDEEAFADVMIPSADGESLIIEDAARFVALMLEHRRLGVRFIPRNALPVRMTFACAAAAMRRTS